MPAGKFMLDFFCGPCLDNDDRNKSEPEYHRRSSSQNNGHRHNNYNNDNNWTPPYGSYSRNYPQSQRGFAQASSRRGMAVPPTINEMEERRSSSSSIGHHLRSSVSSRSNGGNSETSSRSSLDKLQNVPSSNRFKRRDEASVMGASLSETYQGLDDDDNDEYDGRRRRRGRSTNTNGSGRKRGTGGYNSEPESSSSRKSKLESIIEDRPRSQSQPKSSSRSRIRRGRGRGDDENDYDNVTTISKASVNPYHLLGISSTAGPMEIYESYKRKKQEFHPNSKHGSEKAFRDVDNAYRRLKAELKRKEVRLEQKRLERRGSDSNANGRKEKQKKRSKSSKRQSQSSNSTSDSDDDRLSVISGKLRDHRALVKDMFANDAKDKKRRSSSGGSVSSQHSTSVSVSGQVTSLQSAVQSQMCALSAMNLVPIEAGSTNINEQKKVIQNSCFYLSLAASFLSGSGAFGKDPTERYYRNATTGDGPNVSNATAKSIEMSIITLPEKEMATTRKLALQLKRAIEAAVVLVHPDWASTGAVGEEIQAFSDFLVYALDSDSILGHWAVAVFDEASGFVDVYRGRHYGKVYPPTIVKRRNNETGKRKEKMRYKDCDEATKRATTLTLRYIPGHYQPLLPELTKMAERRRSSNGSRRGSRGLERRPCLEEIVRTLEKWKVLHVVTDGRA